MPKIEANRIGADAMKMPLSVRSAGMALVRVCVASYSLGVED
jgi:hypothetical protein